MTQMMSLTKYEHQVLPKFREQLNQAESVEDVKKFFVGTIQEFLGLATGGNLAANYEDISLLPDAQPSYMLASHVTDSHAMKALAASDLCAVLQRIAEQASHRYKHLTKNNVKTNLKIKHH